MMMTSPLPFIETQHLVKRYGDKLAVDDVSLDVHGGEIFGFLGPNGAGKTTTIKMMVGLLQPTSGMVKVGGFDVQRQPMQAKSINGYVPDEPNLYPKLTGRELLRFVGDLYGLEHQQIERRAEELLRLFDLAQAGDDTIDSYSHGMQQKTALAAALVHDPKVLVLDEPTIGLDPKKANWPYKGWSDGDREQFVMRLVRVARDHTLLGFCGSVSVRDYEEVVPEHLKKDTQHPYHFSLQNLFDNVLTAFSDNFPLMLLPYEQVDFSFEQQDEFEKKALDIFQRVKKRDHANRLGSIAFVPKGQFRAHEAADLIAYRMRKVITRQLSGKPTFNPGSWDEELIARKSLVVGYVNRDGLLAMIRELEASNSSRD